MTYIKMENAKTAAGEEESIRQKLAGAEKKSCALSCLFPVRWHTPYFSAFRATILPSPVTPYKSIFRTSLRCPPLASGALI